MWDDMAAALSGGADPIEEPEPMEKSTREAKIHELEEVDADLQLVHDTISAVRTRIARRLNTLRAMLSVVTPFTFTEWQIVTESTIVAMVGLPPVV